MSISYPISSLDLEESAIPQSDLLTVDEVAAFLRTTRTAVYAMAAQGRLPGLVKFGRRVLVRREELRKSVGLGT